MPSSRPLLTTCFLLTTACGNPFLTDTAHTSTASFSASGAGASAGSSGAHGGGDGAGGASGVGGACAVVTGSAVVTHFTADEALASEEDLSAWSIHAVVFDGSPPGFTDYPATVTGPGAFRVEGIPCGATFALRLDGGNLGDTFRGPQETWLITDARTLDVGYSVLGRAGNPLAPSSMPEATGLTPEVTGVQTIPTADQAQWYCPGSGLAGVAPEGDTSDGVWTAPLHFPALAPLPQHDDVWVTQLDYSKNGYRAIGGGVASNVTMAADMYAPLAVDLAIPPTETFAVTVNVPQFVAYVQAANPAAEPFYVLLDLVKQPGGGPADASVLSPTLVEAAFVAPKSNFDASVLFADPFPPTWNRVSDVSFSARLSFEASDGAMLQDTVGAWTTLAYPPAPGAHGPFVSGPRDVTVDAEVPDQVGPLVGVGPTPTLGWKAPALGTAAGYSVSVTALATPDGAVLQPEAKVIWLQTTQTSLRLPPGVLTKGRRYSVHVYAWSTAVDLAAHPFRTTLPSGGADVALPLFEP